MLSQCPHCQKSIDCSGATGQVSCPHCGGRFQNPAEPPRPAVTKQPPISVRCSGCGKQFSAAAQHAGKQTRCPNCKTTITIPSQQVTPPPVPVAVESNPFGQHGVTQPASHKRFDLKSLILQIVVGLVLAFSLIGILGSVTAILLGQQMYEHARVEQVFRDSARKQMLEAQIIRGIGFVGVVVCIVGIGGCFVATHALVKRNGASPPARAPHAPTPQSLQDRWRGWSPWQRYAAIAVAAGFVVLLYVLFVLFLTHERALARAQAILGTWQADNGIYLLRFDRDGTYRYGYSIMRHQPHNYQAKGVYRLLGGGVIEMEGEPFNGKRQGRFSVRGNTLVITWDDGGKATLGRVKGVPSPTSSTPAVSQTRAETVETVPIHELAHAFTNQLVGDQRFRGKRLQVTGVLQPMKLWPQVYLNSPVSAHTKHQNIECTFRRGVKKHLFRQDWGRVNEFDASGLTVTVIGTCTSGNAGCVVLSDCELVTSVQEIERLVAEREAAKQAEEVAKQVKFEEAIRTAEELAIAGSSWQGVVDDCNRLTTRTVEVTGVVESVTSDSGGLSLKVAIAGADYRVELRFNSRHHEQLAQLQAGKTVTVRGWWGIEGPVFMSRGWLRLDHCVVLADN